MKKVAFLSPWHGKVSHKDGCGVEGRKTCLRDCCPNRKEEQDRENDF